MRPKFPSLIPYLNKPYKMENHTQDNSDIAMGMVMADLMKNKIKVLLPVSDHLPFDLIAVDDGMKLSRVQVRYSKKQESGRIHLKLCNSSSYGGKWRTYTLNRGIFDAFAVYSEQLDRVLYVSNKDIPKNASQLFSMRESGGDHQSRPTSDYQNPMNLFK